MRRWFWETLDSIASRVCAVTGHAATCYVYSHWAQWLASKDVFNDKA